MKDRQRRAIETKYFAHNAETEELAARRGRGALHHEPIVAALQQPQEGNHTHGALLCPVPCYSNSLFWGVNAKLHQPAASYFLCNCKAVWCLHVAWSIRGTNASLFLRLNAARALKKPPGFCTWDGKGHFHANEAGFRARVLQRGSCSSLPAGGGVRNRDLLPHGGTRISSLALPCSRNRYLQPGWRGV